MNQPTKINNKYLDFFKGIFNQSHVKNEVVEKDLDLQAIDKQFENFLQAELLDICAEMEVNGYAITKRQKIELQQKIFKDIINNHSKYKLYKDIYSDFDFEFKFNLLKNSEPYSSLSFEMVNDFKDEKFTQNIIDNYKIIILDKTENLKNTVKIKKFKNGSISLASPEYEEVLEIFQKDQARLVSVISHHRSSVSFEEMVATKNLLIKVKEQLNDIIPIIKDKALSYENKTNHRRVLKILLTETHISDIDELILVKKQHAKTDIINNLKLKNLGNGIKQEIVHKYSILELPKETKDLIKEIDRNYQKIKNAKDIQIKMDIDKKMEDINSIVSKYMAIDDTYKSTLKNIEGKSPFDLMMNSLNLIKEDFQKIFQNNNQELVNDLSVLNRKTINKKLI